jgi:nitrogen regulatory protein P-II 1
MKKIEAFIRPERFEFVKKALEQKEIYGMSVTEIKGRGIQKGITIQYRGDSIEVDLIPKIKIEIVAANGDTDTIIEIIKASAWTGKVGDGKIFVTNVERSIRVRTGEEDL